MKMIILVYCIVSIWLQSNLANILIQKINISNLHTESEPDEPFLIGVEVTGLDGMLLRGFGTGGCIREISTDGGIATVVSSSELDLVEADGEDAFVWNMYFNK